MSHWRNCQRSDCLTCLPLKQLNRLAQQVAKTGQLFDPLLCSNLVTCDVIQWNPSIMDTIGNQHFVPYSEVSLTTCNSGASGIFPVSMVSVIGLLSTTWLCFQSFPLLYAGRECYAEASTTSNNANLMSSCELQQGWWKILLKRSTSVH